MSVKTRDCVLYDEAEYEVISVDTDTEDETNVLIEDECGYRLWVSDRELKVIGRDVICFG